MYKITNTVNGKVYIGKSVHLNKRLREHRSSLLKDYHPNKHLQRSWNKYGEKYFTFEILEECSEDIVNEREMYYINEYKSNIKEFGYNMTLGGDGSLGLKHTEESRQKISAIQLGRKLPESHKQNISNSLKGKVPKNYHMIVEYNESQEIPITQIAIKNKTIIHWKNINHCARENDLLATNIVKCLKGKYRTCGGSIFLYKDKFDTDININELIKDRTKNNQKTQGVVQLSSELELIVEYSSMKQAQESGYTRQLIRQCCTGILEMYKGFKWMYKEDYEELVNEDVFNINDNS
ncbi:hypothetical protein CIL05_06885 [Virgibacillus profundi]|uniref:GIY-YIG domain-containing protein n=1 Tax=Virgibacillus profundi TaxID=2024555 RepID=A0A2A2IEW9_9BACI|nr:GIY-YIG nuclease family protein [Virgibacillus profundi]PAV30187.1 hypothetical protein CIL05_06885 [Virgibacillus profundi]PXY54359.1 hypothetical protein CIT14_06970 [Virgibacillus profundi]